MKSTIDRSKKDQRAKGATSPSAPVVAPANAHGDTVGHVEVIDPNSALDRPIADWTDFQLTLNQLTVAYKRVQFDKKVSAAAHNLYTFLQAHNAYNTSQYWAAITLLYELNDILHFAPELNEETLTRGKQLYIELRELQIKWPRLPEISIDTRQLARQKVLYCACGANELKREGSTQEAAKIFEWLLAFIINSIQTESFECYGTQATLSYQLGSLYRILERHEQAEEMFTETLDLLYKKGKQRKPKVDDQLLLVRKQAMAIGIGYGWVNYTRGFLRRAENALVTARSLLARSNDPIVPWYIELLYGTILRCRAGTNKTELKCAIDILAAARQAFEAKGHKRYVPRACWELALAYNLAGQYREAQDHLEVVSRYALQTGHPKWKTNARILQSRLFLKHGDLDNALTEAQMALSIANDYEAALPIIDAYLATGEAKLALVGKGTHEDITNEDARADFQRALDLVSQTSGRVKESRLPSNPKIVAVCELRIAQCFARDGDEIHARQHLSNWRVLRPHVEHEWVRELARTVAIEVENLSQNFTISAAEPDKWDYSKSVARLRGWLLSQALRKTGKNYTEAARLIGVKRATLYQWQEDGQSKSKRARTKI